MPREQILPDKNKLQEYIESGMTHKQIAEKVSADTGVIVGRSAVSVALHRYGIAKDSPRYKEYLPWRVKTQHISAYPARMLRLMGRKATGKDMSDTDEKLLTNWLDMLSREDMIVAYDPDDEQGFHYIDSSFKDTDGSAPIRKKTIKL